MFLRDLLSALKRRWPLSLLALLASVVLCVLAFVVVPPTYQAQANVLLVPPTDLNNPNTNRFLTLGSVAQARDVLVRRLASDAVRARVLTGNEAEYEVAADFTTGAPIVVLTVEAPSKEAVRATEASLLQSAPRVLARLQSEVSIRPSAQISLLTLTKDERPERVGKNQIRAAIAAGAAGLVAGVLAVGLVDGLVRPGSRPRHMRTDRRGDADGVEGPPPEQHNGQAAQTRGGQTSHGSRSTVRVE